MERGLRNKAPFHQSFQAQRTQGEGRGPESAWMEPLPFGWWAREDLAGGRLSGGPSEGEDYQDLALCWARGDTGWYHHLLKYNDLSIQRGKQMEPRCLCSTAGPALLAL